MRKTQDHLKLRTRRRHGYVLVFFAMLVFGLMAMAALVIDLGFARLTQRQMQTASDAAALEGLRGEGSIAYNDRLESARNLAGWHFDDDLDLAVDNGAFDSSTGQFGAGPSVTFSAGAGDPALAASQIMEVDSDNPVYKPEILTGAKTSDGFQVAMKRGGAAESGTDLYSHGPAVPYLFGRGSLMHRDLIQQGIVVRGTGKARYSNAMSVGLANQSQNLPGLAPFAFEYVNGSINYRAPFFFQTQGTMTIGQQLHSPPESTPADGQYPSPGEPAAYAPIYTTLPSGLPLCIVGFVSATVVVENGIATGTPDSEQRAHENAAGVPCGSMLLSTDDLQDVLGIHRQLDTPLQAPISDR